MQVPFVPLEWLEQTAATQRDLGTPARCQAYQIELDQRVVERRWFDRRLEVRESERRLTDRRTTEVERLVHEHLYEFCTPELRAGLDRKFGPSLAARQSTRLLKAA
jgi:hypothetical protein